MKSMNDNTNNTSWLGFSLSPHMTMEAQPLVSSSVDVTKTTSSLPSSVFYPYYSHPANLPQCYGVGGDGGDVAYYSQLSSTTLKSDDPLCIAEALEASKQGIVPSLSRPKLEDFLGGGTSLGTLEQYGNGETRVIASSLENTSLYYQQQGENARHDEDNQISHHHPFELGQQHTYIQPLQEDDGAFPVFTAHGQMYDSNSLVDDWASRNYLDGKGSAVAPSSGQVIDAIGYGDLNSLSLSMSSASNSSCVTALQHVHRSTTLGHIIMDGSKKRGNEMTVVQKQPVHRKSIDTFGQRTSQYRGVTRHRWTGRYEAHLWDNSCKKAGQTRKGRQVYLGGYDLEEKAARAYDLAALKYWGPSTHINFPLEDYQRELEEMKNMTRQEYVAHLRRRSSGFSRGASIYRGVTRHHQHGRWQARIGRVSGNKDLYLGTYGAQEEAAEAYDIAAIKFRGLNAVTNFDISRYDVPRIMASDTLLPSNLAKRNRELAAPDSVSLSENNSCAQLTITNYHPQQHPPFGGIPDPNSDNGRNHGIRVTASKNAAAVHRLVDGDALMTSAQPNDGTGTPAGGRNAHQSSAASLVTTGSNSREGSPDRGALAGMLFTKPVASLRYIATDPTSTWIMPPTFAAWTDG